MTTTIRKSNNQVIKKQCTKCKRTYGELGDPVSNHFYKKKSTADGFQFRCKTCVRQERAAHYLEKIDYYKEKAIKHNAEYRLRNLQYMVDYLKEHPCVDCGETDPIVLEFDHMYDKDCNVSELRTSPIEKLAQEISKCEIRCSNCHRRKTALQFEYYKGINFG